MKDTSYKVVGGTIEVEGKLPSKFWIESYKDIIQNGISKFTSIIDYLLGESTESGEEIEEKIEKFNESLFLREQNDDVKELILSSIPDKDYNSWNELVFAVQQGIEQAINLLTEAASGDALDIDWLKSVSINPLLIYGSAFVNANLTQRDCFFERLDMQGCIETTAFPLILTRFAKEISHINSDRPEEERLASATVILVILTTHICYGHLLE